MKRIISCLILILIISMMATAQKRKIKKLKQKETITSIQFETFARRGQTVVTISKDSATSIGRRERKYILVSNETWTALVNSLRSIKLADIPSWESPTHQREVDGASHCKIIVTTKKGQYESQTFDGGQPMKQLKKLYKKIEDTRAEIEENGQEYQ